MTRSVLLAALALMVAGASGPARAGTGRLADLEVYDRTAGRVLPVYWHDGRHWIAGQPGHEYELRLRSRRPERVLAVTSVDGINVISGQTASPSQGGYVLDRYGSVDVAGWRKDMSRTAAFYFTALADSYAARTGRSADVGVIGVALFREAPPPRRQPPRIASEAESNGYGRDDGAVAGQRAPSADRGRAGGLASESAAPAPSSPMPQERLGTGHGRSEWSSARYTQFRRGSSSPDEVIELWYDSEANLIAQGVIARPSWPTSRPRAFPAGFVPDP